MENSTQPGHEYEMENSTQPGHEYEMGNSTQPGHEYEMGNGRNPTESHPYSDTYEVYQVHVNKHCIPTMACRMSSHNALAMFVLHLHL